MEEGALAQVSQRFASATLSPLCHELLSNVQFLIGAKDCVLGAARVWAEAHDGYTPAWPSTRRMEPKEQDSKAFTEFEELTEAVKTGMKKIKCVWVMGMPLC